MTSGEEDLQAREADLSDRERRAGAGPPDATVLAALAQERDALAAARDEAAEAREEAALLRRQRASDREAAAVTRAKRLRDTHDDADPGFADRLLSGRDVDASAGDRADALDDERHAHEDRQRAREDRQRAAADRDAATGRDD